MAKRVAVLICCVLIALTMRASGQSCPEPLGHWGYGPHDIAAWYGELALIPSGPKLLVVDFRVAAPRSIVGEVRLPGTTIALEVQGDVAYAGVRQPPYAADELLIAIDLSDPANPETLGRTGIARAMSDLAVHGMVASVASLSEGLVLVDVSDPTRLRRLSSMPSVSQPNDVVVRGTYVYVLTSFDLVVVDIADPTNPSVASIQAIGGIGSRLALSEAGLFLLSREALTLFDLTDPAHPAPLGTFEPSGRPSVFDVAGSTAFVCLSEGGGRWMAVIDATDPLDLHQVGRYDLTSRAYDVTADGGGVMVSLGTPGTQLVDVSDPTAPQLFAELPPPAQPGDMNDVAVVGDLAFLADTGGLFGSIPPFGGLRIVDVSEPAEPREISSLAFDEPPRQVAAYGEHVLILRGQEEITPMTLEVIDVSDPSQPFVAGSLQLSGPPWGEVVVSGDHAYVTDYSLNIVDLADPANPVLVSETPVTGSADSGIAVRDDRAYLVGHAGLCIVDVADPTNPETFGCTDVGGRGIGIALNESIAYVSVRNDSPNPPWTDDLRVFDVTDPTTPEEIGSVELWGTAGRVSIDGDLLSVEVLGRGNLVLDITDPTEPKAAGLARVEAGATLTAGRLYAASGFQGLDVFDATSCLTPAPSPDFVWAPRQPTLGEEVTFSDTSPGSPTSWSWDFGDGATSDLRDPGHSFTTPGRNTVTLTASNAEGESSIDAFVPVQSIASPPRMSWIVPAAAHGDGTSGTRWRTDLVLNTSDAVDVVLYLMKQGMDNTLRHGRRISLTRGATAFDDVVSSVFGEDDGAGAIFVAPQTYSPWISSRTYTVSDDGTFGQFIPAIDSRGQEPIQTLIQLTQNDSFRTNLGFVNRLGTPLTVQAQLYSADNTRIAAVEYDVEPFGHLQVNEFISELTDSSFHDGHLALFGGSRADFLAYASVVDATTGDPVFMLPTSPTGEPLWIPAVAHKKGRNGTVWRTYLQVCAAASVAAEYRLELFESGRANLEPRSEAFTLDAGHCARYADVVRTVFDVSTTGALRIVPVHGLIHASSRTFTRRADGGTYGQFIAAVPDSDAAPHPRQRRVIQLEQSSDPSRGFRTNIGILNVGDIPAEFAVGVSGPDNDQLLETSVALEPGEHRQLNGFLEGITSGDLVNPSVTVQSQTVGSRFLAYASVVDNVSGDAVFMPAR